MQKIISQVENNFYNKISPVMNNIVGLNNRDQFSIGLFLKLGVDFDFILDADIEKIDIKDFATNTVQKISKRLTAYVKVMDGSFDKNTAVTIKISYADEADLQIVVDLLKDEDVLGFLSFVYLHETQHILRKHNTKSFSSIMENTFNNSVDQSSELSNITAESKHKLFNIAEDYAINFSLLEFIDDADKKLGSLIKNSGCLYKKEHKNLSEIDILKLLMLDDEITKNLTPDDNSVGANGRLGKTLEGPETYGAPKDANDGLTSVHDKEIDSLGESMKKLIDQQRGKSGFKLSGSIDGMISVDVGWFDKLQQGMYAFINKKTKHSVATWSNIDSKLRHIYNAPRRKNIEKTVDLIVSIDQSGSVSDDSLRKLIFLISKKSKVINSIDLLFHDTEVCHVERFDGKFNKKSLENSVKKVYCRGGTSHADVFKWLDENISGRDSSRKIYISFSDNYSDIEDEYNNHNIIRKISKVWLNSEGRSLTKIPGIQVNFS